MDTHKLAYLAGLIDGEGSITISATPRKREGEATPRYYSRITLTICNCHPGIIDWLHKRFGGSAHWITRDPRYKPSGRVIWGNVDTAAILKMVLPYLIIKKHQALLAIKFHSTMLRRNQFHHGCSENLLRQRARIVSELRALNKRGAI